MSSVVFKRNTRYPKFDSIKDYKLSLFIHQVKQKDSNQQAIPALNHKEQGPHDVRPPRNPRNKL